MFSLRSYGTEVAAHRHAFHQLVLPRAGVLDMEIEGRGGRIERGRAAFVGAGERHAFQARGANRFLVVDLPVERFEPRDESLLERGFLRLDARAELLLAGLADVVPQRPVSVHLWSQLLLDALRGREPASRALHDVRRLIEAEPERRCDPAWAARLCGLSRAQFYRRFTALHGEAPAALQRRCRLALALARLRGTDARVARVAGDVGYSEHSALTRALRRAYGRPPRSLRDG
jgi:AraC-like DNA-binding protein